MAYVREGDLLFRRLSVNEHSVDDAATRPKKQASIRTASKFLTTLHASQLYRLESVSEAAFESATDRFREWTDLGASLTDFIIVAQMEDLDLDHIATFDSHFDAFDVTTVPYRA